MDFTYLIKIVDFTVRFGTNDAVVKYFIVLSKFRIALEKGDKDQENCK